MYPFIENDFLKLFADPKRAELNLKSIIGNLPPSDTSFLARLNYELKSNPVPDEVFNYFEQLTRSVINKVSFYKMLSDFPPIIARLVRIFTSSRFLSELIIKDFQYTYFLIRPDMDCKPFDPDSLKRSIQTILSNHSYTAGKKMDQLRILKRREVLKIGIRDYILDDPIEITTRSISALADELIRATLVIFLTNFSEKYSTPDCDFAIIALGKLGGNELNYSSDIDLMFVYDKEGMIPYGEREISRHEFYNQLCSSFISAIANTGAEGQLYRVDTRLRPDGDSGPLARCVSSYIHYYESRGQLWERQMLIKARTVAGHIDFGNAFLQQLTPFIYPKTFFVSPLQEISKMKWRIEEQKTTDKLNIKICPGGIRDIEFTVQALQLINGGRLTDIRTGNTLKGLTALLEAGLLSSVEFQTLTDSYIFFRKIEHILQIADDRQVHFLSGEQKQASKISFLLGFDSTETFLQRLDFLLNAVRQIYNSVFEITDTRIEDSWDQLFATDSLNELLRKKLTHAGFDSPQNAHRILKSMHSGQFPKMHTTAIQSLFSELLPDLLKEIQLTPNPDHTLLNLERIRSVYAFPELFFKTLSQQPAFLNALIQLCGYTHSFLNVLCDTPANIDYLMTHYKDWLSESEFRQGDESLNFKNLHIFKGMIFLKIALQFQKKIIESDRLFTDLSKLADFILSKVFVDHFVAEDEIAVIGLGKLGGNELSYKSDLDVVFVCSDQADVNDLIAKAKNFLNEISKMTPYGRLYEIDARLRPEGKQAPLVVTLSRYENYLENRAMFWEKQTLVKARFICGCASLFERIRTLFEQTVFEKEITVNEIESIKEMRERQIKEKIKNISDSIHDIKFSRGGLLDVEYVTQACQMKFGKSQNSLRTGSTSLALILLGKLGLIPKADAQVLFQNYLFLRELEVFNYLAFERKSNKLPSDEKQLAFLSKFCKLNKDNRLLDRLSQVKNQNELLFSKLMRELEYGK